MSSRADLLEPGRPGDARRDRGPRHTYGGALAIVNAVDALRLTILAATARDQDDLDADSFEGFADVELMGHRQRVGYVRERKIGGRKMVEIQSIVRVKEADGELVAAYALDGIEVYSAAAIFCLTPIAEDNAYDIARARDTIPF